MPTGIFLFEFLLLAGLAQVIRILWLQVLKKQSNEKKHSTVCSVQTIEYDQDGETNQYLTHLQSSKSTITVLAWKSTREWCYKEENKKSCICECKVKLKPQSWQRGSDDNDG